MSWNTTAARVAAATSRRLGNAVTISSVNGYGILLEPAEEILDGQVVVTDRTLEVPTGTWSSVQEGTAITVDSVAYTARQDGRPSADGATLVIPLKKT